MLEGEQQVGAEETDSLGLPLPSLLVKTTSPMELFPEESGWQVWALALFGLWLRSRE